MGNVIKMIVKEVTNPNNVYRVCQCDLGGIFLNWGSHSRVKTNASTANTRSRRSEYMRREREAEEGGCE